MRSLFFTAALTALLALILSCGATPTTNGPTSSAASGSPTEAYKQLYEAVKAKDTEAIKAAMSKKSQEFAQMVSARNNQPVEKVYENGFTATTFAATIPEIRDERVSGDFGAVEVWNAKDNRWEDLGFVSEASVSFDVSADAKPKLSEAIKDFKGLKMSDSESGAKVEGAVLSSEVEKLRTILAEAGVAATVEERGWKLAVGEMFAGSFKSPGKGRAMKEQEAANAANGNKMIEVIPANGNMNGNVKVIVPKERQQPNNNSNK